MFCASIVHQANNDGCAVHQPGGAVSLLTTSTITRISVQALRRRIESAPLMIKVAHGAPPLRLRLWNGRAHQPVGGDGRLVRLVQRCAASDGRPAGSWRRSAAYRARVADVGRPSSARSAMW